MLKEIERGRTDFQKAAEEIHKTICSHILLQ